MLENNLNELNIFALRDLARRTGVNSPTSKKKEELIKEIKEIISGEKQPYVAKTKQGRPPKVFGYNFANVLTAETLGDDNNYSQTLFNQKVVEFGGSEMKTVAGWVELVNNNSALLWVEKDFKFENYFVPSEVISGINLKMADRVVAEVNLDQNIKIVKKLFSVNDVPVLQMNNKRNDYNNIEHNQPNRKLNFTDENLNGLNIKIGENVYLYGLNNNGNTTAIINMLNSCSIKNKLYVNVSLAEKNKIYVKNIKQTEMFVANITDEIDVVRKVVHLAIERAKRILEQGEDVVVFIDDIASISSVDKEELNLVKNFVSITKEGNKSGSITLIAVVPNSNFYHIEKLADKRLKIENNDIFQI